MVEYSISLDAIFSSLADATRRDILKRVSKSELSVSELASPYKKIMSFAGIAKHVDVLVRAGLVSKRREGKQQIIRMEPRAFSVALTHLEKYEEMWESRFSALDELLQN